MLGGAKAYRVASASRVAPRPNVAWLFVRHLIFPYVAPGTNASARAGSELQSHKLHTSEPTSAVRRSAGHDRSLGPSRRESCSGFPVDRPGVDKPGKSRRAQTSG